jgi:atypical dual specificity phosphatase
MAPLDMSRLSPRLLAGRVPYTAEHVAQLHDAGVTAVVNLCEDAEYWEGERTAVTAAYADAGIAERHLPVTDGGTVPAAVLDAAVALAADHVLYVHCRGGRERSGAVAVAVVARADGVRVDEALRRVRRERPGFDPLPWQLAAVRSWAGEPG